MTALRPRRGEVSDRRFVLLHLALLAAGLAAFAWRMRDFALDDFFITYRYAANLAAGHGLRFNPGEAVFGTTAPGFALLLAALRRLTGAALPHLGTALTVAALLTVAAVVLREAAPRRRPEGVLTAWLLGTSSFLWLHNGGELFAVAAMLAVAGHLAARRPATAGVLAGLAVWCRPDAALGVLALGLFRCWRGGRLPQRFGWPAAATILAGLVAARLWFGSFLPQTLHAKRLQPRWLPQVWPGGADFWPAFLESAAGVGYQTALVPLVLLGAAGALAAFRSAGDGVRTLLLWAAATVIAYPLLGVPMYSWYGIPLLLALLTGYAWAAGAAGRAAFAFLRDEGSPRRPAGAVVAALLAAALVAAPVVRVTAQRARLLLSSPPFSPRLDLYRETGEWMAAHAPPDARLAAIEVGAVGFYSQRHVHDLMGLVSPQALPGIAGGDLVGAFRAGDPDHFLYFTPQAALLDRVRDALGPGWREAARFETAGQTVVLYHRPAEGDVLRWGSLPIPDSQEVP